MSGRHQPEAGADSAAGRVVTPPTDEARATDHEWAGDEDGHNCQTCIEQDDHFRKCDRLAHAIASVQRVAVDAADDQLERNLRETGSIAGPGFRP